MISLPSKTNIWIAGRFRDMSRGFTGLSAAEQTVWDGDGRCNPNYIK